MREQLLPRTIEQRKDRNAPITADLRDMNGTVYNRLHKWHLNLNNNTDTSLDPHSLKNSFVLKDECEAKDVPSIVIQI